jgi:hypothetical protein
MSDIDTLLKSIIDLLDVLSYLYISSTCAIFLHLHGEFESAVQEALRPLCGTKKKVPRWLTVEFIAYARLYLAIPTILFLAWGYRILPSMLVLVVHLADSFKEIVGKYWSRVSREIGVSAEKRADQSVGIYPTFFKSGVAESSDFGKYNVTYQVLLLKSLFYNAIYTQKLSPRILQEGCFHYA